MEFHGQELTRNAVSAFFLTGLSTATASAAVATDTILVGIGKLEARMPVAIPLTAAFPRTTTALTNVTGWSVPVVAGQTYLFKVIATYQSAAPGTGGRIGLATAGAVGTVAGWVEGAISNVASAAGLVAPLSTLTSQLLTTGVGTANQPVPLNLEFFFTCTTSGTINIQWASEVNASSSQINAGSALIYQRFS